MDILTTNASDGEKPKGHHCNHSVSSPSESAKLKFKRPKVFATRDFPVSFKRFNAQRNGCGDDSEAEPREVDHVEPQKGVLHSEKDDFESDGGYNSEDLDRSGKLGLQYLLTKMSYSAPDFAKMKFKRRKVSAIRDFPVGFEKFGAGRANGSANDSDEDIDEPLEIDDYVESHQNSLHSETHELSPCLVSTVEADVASDPEMVESEVKKEVLPKISFAAVKSKLFEGPPVVK